MRVTALPVTMYLMRYVAEAYKGKYGYELDYNLCTIQSIRKGYGFDYAYRIDTPRGDDHLVFHLYFSVGDPSRVLVLRPEVVENVYTLGSLIDELFTVTAIISNEHYDYRFPWIEGEWSNHNLLVYQSEDYLCTMDGSPLTLMPGTVV